jgi:hypothetical protein
VVLSIFLLFARKRIEGGRNAIVDAEIDGLQCFAHVAQLVEHVLGKDEVIGSIPIVGSRKRTGV